MWWQAVLLVLTVARVTRFITTDALGRHLIIYPLVRLGSWRLKPGREWVLEGLECTWCVSVWAAGVFYVLYRLVPWAAVEWICWPLAISYVVGVLSRWLEG